jgi:hypothetical protein
LSHYFFYCTLAKDNQRLSAFHFPESGKQGGQAEEMVPMKMRYPDRVEILGVLAAFPE